MFLSHYQFYQHIQRAHNPLRSRIFGKNYLQSKKNREFFSKIGYGSGFYVYFYCQGDLSWAEKGLYVSILYESSDANFSNCTMTHFLDVTCFFSECCSFINYYSYLSESTCYFPDTWHFAIRADWRPNDQKPDWSLENLIVEFVVRSTF